MNRKYRVDGKCFSLLGHGMLDCGCHQAGTTTSLDAHELGARKLCNISDVSIQRCTLCNVISNLNAQIKRLNFQTTDLFVELIPDICSPLREKVISNAVGSAV